jgi:hypothetical protein
MCGAIPPLPNTSSWCGAQLKLRDDYTFTFCLMFTEPKNVSNKIRSTPQDSILHSIHLIEITGDYQHGFRHNRSITDQIFYIQQILEKMGV